MHKCFSVLSNSVPVLGWNTPSTSGEKRKNSSSTSLVPQTTSRSNRSAVSVEPLSVQAVVSVWHLLWWRDKMAEAEWEAQVVLKQEAVSGGGASMQTGNTLELRSVASFHKQHHRRVPDVYDLRSGGQQRPDSNPSLHVCSRLAQLNLPNPSLLFSQMKTPDVSYGCQRGLA